MRKGKIPLNHPPTQGAAPHCISPLVQVLFETNKASDGQNNNNIKIKTELQYSLLHNKRSLGHKPAVPVIAGIHRQRGTGWIQLPLVVTRAPAQGHAAALQQVEARGAVAAVVTGGDTLHLSGGHVQTHARTCGASSLALC